MEKIKCFGAIIGDVVGSVYEFNNYRRKDFPLISKRSVYTDDTILTLAVHQVLEKNILDKEEIAKIYKEWTKKNPNCGYGCGYLQWVYSDDLKPYNSYGNGAAMRISPVAWFANTEEEVRYLSELVTSVTHNHPEGLKGAEVTAMCIFYARIGKSKEFIKDYASKYYNLDFNYEDLKKNYWFNETCQNTVPQAIYCFLISNSFEDCLRTSVSIGGDTDTLCAISCAIAEAFYKDIDFDLLEKVINIVNKCNYVG